MRIAFISYELPPDIAQGGIGTYTLQAAEAMQNAGNNVAIFCASPSRDSSALENKIWIERILCSSPSEFTYLLTERFSSVHSAKNFDIIECPEIHGNALGIKQIFPNLPLVVRLHGPGRLVESLKKKYTSQLIKWRFELGSLRRGKFTKWDSYDKENDPDFHMVAKADVVTAPSESMKEWAMKNWLFPDNLIKVVPNIFEVPQELLVSDELNEPTEKIILFFGRLNVLKGLVNFTKAIKEFKKQNEVWL